MQVFTNKIAIAAFCILLVIAVAFFCVRFSVSLVKATAPDPAQIQQTLLGYTENVGDQEDVVTYNYSVKLSLKDIAKHGPKYYVKLIKKFCVKNKGELEKSPDMLVEFLEGIGEVSPIGPITHEKMDLVLDI